MVRTIEWWETERDFYELYISQFVFLELNNKPFPGQERALEVAKSAFELENNSSVNSILGVYIDEFVMPSDIEGDAAHLAIASFYGMDYLLTWNCKHLANIKKKRHIETINRRLSLAVPEIITPNVLRLEES